MTGEESGDNRITPAPSPDRGGSSARLLNREVAPEYLVEWTAQIAREKVVTQPGIKSVVIFRIDEDYLALSTKLFQEVVEQCTIRTLPYHNAIVKGLVNVRGELLVCISLRILLGVQEPQDDPPQTAAPGRVLILNRDGGRFALEVSEVHGIHRYHPSELFAPPATLTKGLTPSYTAGILRWNGKAVSCLAEDSLVYALHQGLA